MRTLKVAVICRAKAFDDTRLKQGWWSYPVPEFEWQFFPQPDEFALNTAALRDARFDCIFHEDWVRGDLAGHHLPTFYAVVDSNTSERRLLQYQAYAVRTADVILLDQDEPEKWANVPKPVYRWPYAVNERVFTPEAKTVDVACHVEPTPARRELCGQLAQLSQHRDYQIALGNHLPTADYAAALGRAKIAVHLGTYPQCRSHRVFDALASWACLLTSPLPDCGDGFVAGTHYLEWRDFSELVQLIDDLLRENRWQAIARQGHDFVLGHHTWATRAKELREIMAKEFQCLS